MSIHNWPKSEQPRQKLLTEGAKHLSDAELLAIFLRTGTYKQSALALARDLLTQFGNLRTLLCLSETDFCKQHGLGSTTYALLQAALELTTRYIAAPWETQTLLTNPKEVHKYLLLRFAKFHQQEVFACLLLNQGNHVIRFQALFYGTFNRATIYPRECARLALHYNATSMIIAHNHPSGKTTPSEGDKKVTQLIKKALKAIDVELFDHIVVGHQHCSSFSTLGLL